MNYLLILFVYLILPALIALALYALIKGAVRSALEEHYKTVRWYERTGEWAGRRAPRSFDSAISDVSVK